jgi:hypothetical protein
MVHLLGISLQGKAKQRFGTLMIAISIKQCQLKNNNQRLRAMPIMLKCT